VDPERCRSARYKKIDPLLERIKIHLRCSRTLEPNGDNLNKKIVKHKKLWQQKIWQTSSLKKKII
jgi:hypothetical protein